MAYLYFDESGDLGFDFSKNGTSGIFSIAMLIVADKRPITSLVKKIFASLPKATKRKNSGTLHASYEKASTIEHLLRGLAKKEVLIASIRLDKRNALISSNPNDLYNHLVVTLINRLFADGFINYPEDIVVVASRRSTSKTLNTLFSNGLVNSKHGSALTVRIVKPYDDKCLQAADFVSWALWQKYEKGDESFAKLLCGKIIREYILYC